ncbi:MAG: phospholipase D-like domain-containing protein [Thermomicrobiales bacterium]
MRRLYFGIAVALLLATGSLVAFHYLGSGVQPRFPAVPTSSSAPDADGGVVGVILEPDDGPGLIVAELDAARRTIDIEVYLFSDQKAMDALLRAERRGVRVRVILEQHPFGGGDAAKSRRDLERLGVEVRWAQARFDFSHIKCIVVDDRVALIMNLNLTYSGLTKNREAAVTTTNASDVAEAMAVFAADWDGQGDPTLRRLVLSPTTSRVNSARLIDGATTSIDLFAEVVRDTKMVKALEAAAGRGVRVRIVTPPTKEADNTATLVSLVKAGVEVRTQTSPYVHAKMILVDGARAFVGSQNLTRTSLGLNRELGIVIVEPAGLARLRTAFEKDFGKARRVAGS